MVFQERFCPGVGWTAPWVRHQHLTRYRWAARYAAGCAVVDAACGSGYGSVLLRGGGAASVDGFDIDPEAVRIATARAAGLDGVTFREGDATRLPLPAHSRDLYVSFETIEHLADDRAFVDEAVRVLRPGGRFVCSTPNRNLLDPGTGLDDAPASRFHVREYTFKEFRDLLAPRFRTIEWYGQSWYRTPYVRALDAVGRSFPRLAVRLHQARKLVGSPWESSARHYPTPMDPRRQAEILIAVCTA
jgi:SAM-dependent methyltransferase